MPKTLYLLRHGKSSWADPQNADFDRPLTRRGQRAAAWIGTQLAARSWQPALVLASPAARTRQTFDILNAAYTKASRPTVPLMVQYQREIYLASAEELFRRIAALPEDIPSVLLIGHNPGLHDLALSLASGAEETVALLRRGLPTAALAVLMLDAAKWSNVTSGCGHLEALIIPPNRS